MPELAASIDTWKKKKSEADISLGTSEVKSLISDLVVDQDLIAALVEAEQIGYAAQRALIDASDKSRRADNDVLGEHDETPETNDDDYNGEIVGSPLTNAIAMEGPLPTLKANMYNETPQGFESKHWGENSARVLEISKPKRTVTMNVPGSGVRPFYFTDVNDAENSARVLEISKPKRTVTMNV